VRYNGLVPLDSDTARPSGAGLPGAADGVLQQPAVARHPVAARIDDAKGDGVGLGMEEQPDEEHDDCQAELCGVARTTTIGFH
jgi:hypothetical protein